MNKRILVVDDEEMIRDMQAESLELEGYSCFTASGMEAALNMLEETSVDLALVDINMPGQSGIQCCGRTGPYPELAVLMFPAVDDFRTAMTCLDLRSLRFRSEAFQLRAAGI